jgi:toxin CptA
LPDSSIDCCPCRLEWRPSRWYATVILLLWPAVVSAVLATRWATDMPEPLAWLLVLVAMGLGAWRARCAADEPRAVLDLLPAGWARWMPLDGPMLEGPAIAHEQWPVITVRFAKGGTTVVFWPDTLCAPGRRLLRRWARSATPVSPLPQFWMG